MCSDKTIIAIMDKQEHLFPNDYMNMLAILIGTGKLCLSLLPRLNILYQVYKVCFFKKSILYFILQSDYFK